MSSITVDLSHLSKPGRNMIFSYGVNNLNDFFDFLKKTFGLKSWKEVSDWLYNKKFDRYDILLIEAAYSKRRQQNNNKDTGTVSTTGGGGTTGATSNQTNNKADPKANLDCNRKRKLAEYLAQHADDSDDDDDDKDTGTVNTTAAAATAAKNADPKANLDRKKMPGTYNIWDLSWTGRKSICFDSGAKDLDDYLNEFKSKKQLLDCILGNSEFSGNDIIIIMGKYFERHADNDSDDDNDDLSDNESDDDSSSKTIKILSTDWCRVVLITVLVVLIGLVILAPTTTTTTKNDDDDDEDGFDNDDDDIPTTSIPIVSDDKATKDEKNLLKLAVKNVDEFYKVFGVEVSIGPTGNDDQEVFEVVNLPGVEKENIDEFLAPFSDLSVADVLEIKSQLFASSDTPPTPTTLATTTTTTTTTTKDDDDDKKTKLQKELAIQQSILDDNKHKLAAWNYLFEVQNKKVEELKEELSTL